MARAVINRRTEERYESASHAGQVLGKKGVRGAGEGNIGLAVRATEDGLYATAAGDQWAFVDSLPKVWPEKGKSVRRRVKTARALRKAQEALAECAEEGAAESFPCPVTGERCPQAEFVGRLLDLLRDEKTDSGRTD